MNQVNKFILLVSVDDPPQRAEALLQKLGVDNLPSAYAYDSDLAGWPIIGVPSNFLISPEGQILGHRLGPLDANDPILAQQP